MEKKITYQGKTCIRCGSNVRYIQSRRCVNCKHIARVKAWAKEKAEKEATSQQQ